MQKLTFEKQSMNFPAVRNARELGTYVMSDGRTIRRGMLFRGAALSGLDDVLCREFAQKFKIERIFDLRTEAEAHAAPDRNIPGVEYRSFSVLDLSAQEFDVGDKDMREFDDFIDQFAFTPTFQKMTAGLYDSLLLSEYSQNAFRRLFRELVDKVEGGIFWHCSQGKDRTGVFSALLLFILGADKELVMGDFDLSNEVYSKEIEDAWEKVQREKLSWMDYDAVKATMGVSVSNLQAAFDKVTAKYGDMDAYLSDALGISEQDRNTLRERYLIQ